MLVEMVVRDLAGNPVDGARLDVWQTAPNGFYDVQDDGQPAMNLRGIVAGAGIGGLTAALALHEAGVDVLVLVREPAYAQP